MTSLDHHQQYLDTLTRLGGSAGNVKLREALGWDEPTYDSVHAELKALGKIVPGRGRGGSVSIPGADAPLPEPVPTASDEEIDSFLGALTRAGGASGNVTMRALLGWDEDRYFRVQKALIALGKITTGKGRGGSVQLAGQPAPPSLFDELSKDLPANAGDVLTGSGETTKPKEDNLVVKTTPDHPSETSPKMKSAPATKKTAPAKAKDNTATIGFEQKLWLMADKLRNNMDAAEYKHVVLGLIFLKYISDTFEEHRAKLLSGEGDYAGANAEDPDEYKAENIFWVPTDARWSHLQANARQATIGKIVDDAMVALERDNPRLKGVLPKDYARPGLDKQRLGELIDLIATIELTAASEGEKTHRSVDLLGRVYEYFLTRFASAEGKNGGQFYTPSCVVRCLVEMLAPYKGRIYDPACGSGGMFVQSEKFVESHGGKIGDISIYGQESNATTRRLAIMNLAIRGIEADFGPEHADTFRRVLHPDLRADYLLANPPFNDSDWFRKDDDVRWQFGVPPKGNANFAWVQHFIHHLAPSSPNGGGMAGFVLANGSMSSNQSGEGEIRKAIIEADLVDCMVALPGQLFYSTQIPVCLWFLTKNKNTDDKRGFRDRRKQTLFIDARKMGTLIDRVHRELTDDDLEKITTTYHAWRTGGASRGGAENTEKNAIGTNPSGDSNSKLEYSDIPGFCKSATKEEIAGHGYVLTPGRYVGAEEVEDDGEPFEEKMARLVSELNTQFAESAKLEQAIKSNLRRLGYGG